MNKARQALVSSSLALFGTLFLTLSLAFGLVLTSLAPRAEAETSASAAPADELAPAATTAPTAFAPADEPMITAQTLTSWRFTNGQPLANPRTDAPASAAGVATAAQDPYVHFTRTDATWSAELAGAPITVTNAQSFGVDVSDYNGVIDWERAKRAGVGFAILCCGFGGDNPVQDDAMFLTNFWGCQQNNIPVGVSLTSYATTTEQAAAEADHVLRLLSNAGIAPADLDLPIYYDMELSSLESTLARQLLASIAETFCTRLEQSGYQPGVYANYYWWKNYLTEPAFDRWERWVADWLVEGKEQAATQYTGNYGLWQCLGNGYVDGIGRVDINFDYRRRAFVPQADMRDGAVFRLYNPWNGIHMYTADADEATSMSHGGWNYEGRNWTAPVSGKPVYRLYNPWTGDHHFTSKEGEYQMLGSNGWQQEGAKFYTDDNAPIPVYRLFNPYVTIGAHLMTCDYDEYQRLPGSGWQQEGICCRAIAL